MSSQIRSINDPQVVSLLRPDALSKLYHPSPIAWEDQVLYFLLPDRFSDDAEANFKDINGVTATNIGTPMYSSKDDGNALSNDNDKQAWLDAGSSFVGGNLKGATSKLGYLKRLGVTAIWIGPLFKQVKALNTYHGYGPQNFLDVDPRFGTIDDLKTLVATAHQLGIYVLFDIILNHTGNVFRYKERGPLYNGKEYEVEGFYDAERKATIPFGPIDETAYPNAFPDAAIWPAEMQVPEAFTRKGRINDDGWDNDPEFLEGDFYDLKDVNLGQNEPDGFEPTTALKTLCEVYKYWIAVADIDGYRIDTVKHMGDGPTRYFASVIHEYAQTLGKDNFLLIGEITGTRAFETVEATGIDAALGIGAAMEQLWKLPKGYTNPSEYFNLFRNALYLNKGSHTWFRNRVVTMIDDHDQVWRGGEKGRFCSQGDGEKLIIAALALNLCTLGIPCIYYGSEQCFDGSGVGDDKGHGADHYIREAMFGGAYGPFRSKDRHCFNENTSTYIELAKIAAIRKREVCLRRGRQYLRDISGDGINFGPPTKFGNRMRAIVAWSRLFVEEEILCAINTDPTSPTTAWVTVDEDMNPTGKTFHCLYPSGRPPLKVLQDKGRSAFQLTVPPGGFVMYKGRASRNAEGRPSTR